MQPRNRPVQYSLSDRKRWKSQQCVCNRLKYDVSTAVSRKFECIRFPKATHCWSCKLNEERNWRWASAAHESAQWRVVSLCAHVVQGMCNWTLATQFCGRRGTGRGQWSVRGSETAGQLVMCPSSLCSAAPSLFNWLIKTLLEHWESCKMHGRNEQRHAVILYEIIECEWPMNTEPERELAVSTTYCLFNSKAIQKCLLGTFFYMRNIQISDCKGLC